ncbi:MAG: biotin/lipoyl-containing protein [Promethearchaeota archaeon]
MSEVFNFDDGKQRFEVRLRRNDDNSYVIVINREDEEEKELQVSAKILGAGQFQFSLENIIYKCSVSKDGNIRFIHLDGEDYEIKRVSEAAEEEFGEAEEDLGSLSSPMPGRIVKLLVKPGDRVKKGQDLIIVEAMKMENKIASPIDGVVKKVFFPEGDQIEANVPLIEIDEDIDHLEESEDKPKD